MIPNRIISTYVLLNRSPPDLFPLNHGDKHSQPQPVPLGDPRGASLPKEPKASFPHTFTTLLALPRVSKASPSQTWRTDGTHFLIKDISPTFFLPINRFAQLQVCGLPTVQRSVKSSLKITEKNRLRSPFPSSVLHSHADDKSVSADW